MKNSILHQIDARYEEISGKKIVLSKRTSKKKRASNYFFIRVIFSFNQQKRLYENKKINFPLKYTRYGKNIYFKQIYNFDVAHFSTGFISFLHY